MKKLIWFAIGGIIISGVALILYHTTNAVSAVSSHAAASYRTQAVETGTIEQSISVTGSLSPLHTVKVGTEISGTISKIYADFNQHVEKGDKLAEIEPSVLASQLAQSRALMSAARAKLEYSEKTYKRTKALLEKDYVAQQDMDIAEQDLENAKAQMVQAAAQVEKDRTSLEHATIRSPISGVVISRDVDVGQTVAASFQTPQLFNIAQDMKKMQITAVVSEADIGAVKSGTSVSFSVDAFPSQSFAGIVSQIRLNSNNQQNVVTYNVLISVENNEEQLLPGMTALVNMPLSRRENILKVPTAALRFKPENMGSDMESLPKSQRYIYVLDGRRQIHPVKVTVGISDGKFSEVSSSDIKAGDQVILETTASE